MTVKLRVLTMLEERNKTKYWLWKQMGMSYQNFNKMVNNETSSIRFETIEALCTALECEPGELFSTEDEQHV